MNSAFVMKIRKFLQDILEISFFLCILIPVAIVLSFIKLAGKSLEVFSKYTFIGLMILMNLINQITPKQKRKKNQEKTKLQLLLTTILSPFVFLMEYVMDEE